MENQPLPPTEYDRILTIQLFKSEARAVSAAIDNALGEPCEQKEKHCLQSARSKIATAMKREGTE